MPYHVQVRRSFRRAWAFNVSEEQLRSRFLVPWRGGRAFELGDRWWEPADSDIRVIEGPELAAADLAHGQGWNAAERSGEDVTRRILASPADASSAVTVLAENAETGEAAALVLRAAGFDVTVAPATP